MIANSWKLEKLLPFLIVDAAIVVVLLLLAQIDYIVHGTLYSFGLVFSMDWAFLYWIAFRLAIGLLGFTMFAVTLIGYFSYKKALARIARTAFICRSCGGGLAELTGSVNLKEPPPRFKVLKECPLCSEKLLD